MISHLSQNNIYGSIIVEIRAVGLDCKLVSILGKTVQGIVLDSK